MITATKFLAANAHVDEAAILPLPNSRKIYVEGSRPDLQVPMREISQADTPTAFGGASLAVHLATIVAILAMVAPEPPKPRTHPAYRTFAFKTAPEVERAMRLRTVEEDRDRRDGDVRRHQGEGQDLPPRGLQEAVGQPLHQRVAN